MESNRVKPIIRFICCLSLFVCGIKNANAQTFAEWFSQKKTQIKYLTQQIAALEQYGAYVKQGYEISHLGLSGIGSHLKYESDLHSGFYSSLKSVNPEIKGTSKVDSIISYSSQIPRQFDKLGGVNGLSNENQQYVAQVREKVLAECNTDLAELQMVISNGEAQLTDDERISRIDQIYDRVKDKYVFTRAFCVQVRTLLLQQNQELQDIQSLGRYYEFN